jgi:kynurenine 3-monooxygenase
MEKEIIVVGAGLTGLMISIYLAKRGYALSVYDYRPDPRKAYYKYGSGRSMSLDLSVRGLLALSEIDLSAKVLAYGVPMKRRAIHLPDGELIYIPYGKNENDLINAVSRSQVHKDLLEKAESFGSIKVNFNQKFVDFDACSGVTIFRDQIDNKDYKVEPFILIGCDGVNSSVRACVEKTLQTVFKKEVFGHQYKEVKIPLSLGHKLELQAMHMWPRENYMLVAQPNYDGSFTCALLLPREGDNSFNAMERNGQKFISFFKENFSDAYPLIPTLADEIINNPIGSLTTITEGQWNIGKKVLLLGDSVHAMVPFFGQGMNCCFEDCYLLNQYLNEFNDDWDLVIPLFEKERKVDANAIANMSLTNYPELTKSNWRNFVLQREIESFLMNNFKDSYISYHNLVCFDNVPYRYAQSIRSFQKNLINEIIYKINSIKELNKDQVKEAVNSYEGTIKSIFPSTHIRGSEIFPASALIADIQ